MQPETIEPVIVAGTPLPSDFVVTSEDHALVEASLELIRDPTHFSTLYVARDKDGHWCQPSADDAVSWCAVGTFDRYPSCFTEQTRAGIKTKMNRFLRTMRMTGSENKNYHRTIPNRIAYIQDLNDKIIAILDDDGRKLSGHDGVVHVFQKFLELPITE